MSEIAKGSIESRGRDALGRHEWSEAYDVLTEADAKGTLTPAELGLLAEASWWVGRLPAAIEARERAYAGFVHDGDPTMAALMAALIGQDNLLRGSYPVARAWLNRADRHLAGVEQGAVHGWVAVVRAFQASLDGDYEAALNASLLGRQIAERFGDRDLAALALSCEGLSRIHRGDVEAGLALVDEATVAAVGGEIEPTTAGGVCCSTIEACAALGDWQRAAQWTEAQDRWCKREHISGFPGMCRVFRANIKRLRGDWLAAESEARRATDELAGCIPAAVGMALFEIGLIRLRRGDLDAAEEALSKAHDAGRDPEPAWSLLELARGRPDAAAASIHRALEDPDPRPTWWAHPSSELNRLALLPAQVEIALATGDFATARAAADELAMLAERFPSTQSRANAAGMTGAVLVAEGHASDGIRRLREALGHWAELEAPYEVAQTRVALATGYAADGDARQAQRELEAALQSFERLGAVPDAKRVAARLATGSPAAPRRPAKGGQRVIRTFMFTDIVNSTQLAEILGDDAWTTLIRWHDSAIRTIIAEHGGEEIKATGDGFFLAFTDIDQAIEAAIDLQRRFETHRQQEGFAPTIRIGLHQAEASRAGLDYIGGGVNIAARVGSVAKGGEIVASFATLDAARRPVPAGDRRAVALKGISEEVDVRTIEWR
jgi:class 3 adenylate cyclase